MSDLNGEHRPVRRGLIFLRGQGETTWMPHRDVAWLRETPAGLELDLDDALRESERQQRPGLVLLGHPGGGKTATLQRIASMCREGRAERLGLAPEAQPTVIDLADWRRQADSLKTWLDAQVGRGAARGSGLCLVDSLDRLELGDRREAADWLRDAAETRGHRLVVTCRFEGYEPGTELGNAFFEIQLYPHLPPEPLPRLDSRASSPKAGVAADSVRALQGGYGLTAVPGGELLMGSPDHEPEGWADERPARRVEIAPFYLGTRPVTRHQLGLFLRAQPSETPPAYFFDPRFNDPSQPAVGVGWDQAQRYAAWAGLRLPTEAEWEYACRAGTSTARYGELDEVAWHGGNSGGALHPVGTRAANPWGFFDMLGNAWEWVEDDHHPSYEGAPTDGSAWIDDPRGPRRLLRGGSWADNPRTVRAATRLNHHPGPRVGNIGFRLAADYDAPGLQSAGG